MQRARGQGVRDKVQQGPGCQCRALKPAHAGGAAAQGVQHAPLEGPVEQEVSEAVPAQETERASV